MHRMSNRLIHEKSPYLKQHAHNPVDWYPWSQEAFARAEGEDRLIFLSIGYSSCHWCHVMERESFENEEVAKILNASCVCIKVDREERPDIDEAFMHVCHVLSRQCGWPLSIFLTPDKQPFFAASYLPPTTRYQHPGLMELTTAFGEMWKEGREKILETAREISAHLEEMVSAPRGQMAADFGSRTLPGPGSMDACFAALEKTFDSRHAGFGNGPKFPSPCSLGFLLAYYGKTRSPRALDMVRRSLTAMRLGGIWDHAGWGFHRYSTDSAWLLPHFEKMLYDQAMLVLVYLQGFQATHDPLFARTAREILHFVREDMTGEGMGFFSALDADSEGEEGTYYLWSMDEFRELAGGGADIWAARLGLESGGNFLDEATKERTGTNILFLRAMLDADAAGEFEKLRLGLLARRRQRVPPFRDEKVLTDWNGLMVAAFARAARVLGDREYAAIAVDVAAWLLGTMRTQKGRLMHRYYDGDVGVTGLATDYACVIWGLVELYQTVFDPVFLEEAVALQEILDGEFWDERAGCYTLAARTNTDLPAHPPSFYDGPVPSHASVILHALCALFGLTRDMKYRERADRLLAGCGPDAAAYPAMVPYFLAGADIVQRGALEIVIEGDKEAAATREMLAEINARLLPGAVVRLSPMAPQIQGRHAGERGATAYVCADSACRKPVTSARELAGLLDELVGA